VLPDSVAAPHGAEGRPHTRVLSACERSVTIDCPDADTAALVDAAFGPLRAPSGTSRQTRGMGYRIERSGADRGFRIFTDCKPVTHVDDADGLLFHLDKCLTIALQRERPELYFLHGAAVALGNRVAVLAAPPGTGKSTLAMAMLQRGAAYLSDELAPIDVSSLLVYPFPHALCLKAYPPAPLRVPAGTAAIGKRLHIAPALLGAAVSDTPLPLGAFLFVHRSSQVSVTSRRISAAAGAAHLLANSLNALAHQDDGLAVAVGLARRVPSFELNASNLDAACADVDAIFTA